MSGDTGTNRMTRSRSYEWFVGLRYIWSRSGNRFISFISTISILGITVGVAVLVVVLSVVNGFETELRLRILSMTSHASITAYEGGLSHWGSAAEIATEHPRVTHSAPFIEGEGMLVHDEAVSGVAIRGVLPAEELAVSGIGSKMTEGDLGDLTAGSFHIVMGAALAEELGVSVGDKVIMAVNQGTVTPAGL
ncbi:MAG: ABC transporter permease, partial [Gammaproteobacteria bacterium]